MSDGGDMERVPGSAAVLGAAGLIPFVWGAVTVLRPDLGAWGAQALGPRFVGPYVQLYYGAVILSFMSGVLWGFATRASGREAAAAYGFSVIPALWAFFMTGGGPEIAAVNLIGGYLGLLALDWQFARWGLAPAWWLRLRVPLSAVVVLCLVPVAW